MKEQIIEVVAGSFSLPVATVLLATLPIIELRGALPVALLWSEPLSIWTAYPLAVLGNMLPIPLIIWFLEPVTRFVRRWKYGERFVEWLFARTRRKGRNIERYEFWGLVLFVAIPLPMTGAWTGAMAGHIFGFGRMRNLAACFLGVCLAGVVMSAASVFARETVVRMVGLSETLK